MLALKSQNKKFLNLHEITLWLFEFMSNALKDFQRKSFNKEVEIRLELVWVMLLLMKDFGVHAGDDTLKRMSTEVIFLHQAMLRTRRDEINNEGNHERKSTDPGHFMIGRQSKEQGEFNRDDFHTHILAAFVNYQWRETISLKTNK